MAITRAALGTGAAKSAAITVTIGNVILAGDTIIAVTAGDTAVTAPRYYVSTADVTGTALTADATATNSGNVVTQIWRLSSPSASVDSGARVTSPIATIAHAMAVSKLAGCIVSPMDVSAVGTGTGVNASTGATAPLSQADEICMAALGTEGPDGDAAGTWGNGFSAGQRLGTTGGGAAGNITVAEGYYITSVADAVQPSITSITSRDWAAAVVTYRANLPPTVALNTADAASFSDTTPTLEFTGTDVDADDIRYQAQIDPANTFDSWSAGFDLKYVDVNLVKLGSPADNLTLEVLSGSMTGTVLGTSGAVAASSVPTSYASVRFTFATAVTLAVSTKYYLRLTRSGSRDLTNYFIVRIYLSSAYSGGGISSRNNNTWSGESGTDDWQFILYDTDLIELVMQDLFSSSGGVIYGGTATSGENQQAHGQTFTVVLPLLNKLSNADSGFVNTVSGGDTDPFNSGEKVSYTVQAGEELAAGTYYWRVRGLDPTGSGGYGAWSETRSFAITSASMLPTQQRRSFVPQMRASYY